MSGGGSPGAPPGLGGGPGGGRLGPDGRITVGGGGGPPLTELVRRGPIIGDGGDILVTLM